MILLCSFIRSETFIRSQRILRPQKNTVCNRCVFYNSNSDSTNPGFGTLINKLERRYCAITDFSILEQVHNSCRVTSGCNCDWLRAPSQRAVRPIRVITRTRKAKKQTGLRIEVQPLIIVTSFGGNPEKKISVASFASGNDI